MRTSVLPEGVALDGEVRGTGDLVVRGVIIGNVDLDGLLTVEAGGLVRGEVRARSMVVRGLVEGPVVTLELLRLEAGARVVGDVQADRVSAASGAVIRGRVRMTGADRLRRTAGGTLTAPFTSSGQLEAPPQERQESVRGALDVARLVALTESDSIRERTTEVPEDRSAQRQDFRARVTESPDMQRRHPKVRTPLPVASLPSALPVTAPVVTAPVVAASTPNAIASVPRAASADARPLAPPPPVIPRLGRVKSRRREESP